MTQNLSFAAFDVETANPKYSSICAIGIAVVRNGVRTGTRSWLCRPPVGVDSFAPMNMSIHKITPAHVADKPRFAEIWPEVLTALDGLPIVAHNARFDTAAVRQACGQSRIAVPSWTYGCTKEWAQSILALPDNKLPTVAAALNVPLYNHHDAATDAAASADVTVRLAEYSRTNDLHALARFCGRPLRQLTGARA